MKKMLVLLAMVLVMVLTFGCAPITTIKDELPTGIPKGYVEFYRLWSDSQKVNQASLIPDIYSIDRLNQEVKEGQLYFASALKQRGYLRLARTPGIHHFIVRLGTANQAVHVNIVEGMVVPVRIIFTDIEKSNYVSPPSYGRMTVTTTTKFGMSIDIESPIPYKEGSKK